MSRSYRNKRIVEVSVLFVAFLLFSPFVVSAQAQPFTLTVIHVNDTHSHIEDKSFKLSLDNEKIRAKGGSFARLAAKVKQLKEKDPNTLFLHAGDLVQGTLYFNVYKGEAEVNLMNQMDLDAMVVGNHEFDRGPVLLAGMIKQAKFPMMAANVDDHNDPNLKGLLTPYIIKTFNGEKVGIFGLVTSQVPHISSPGKNLIFSGVVSTAKKMVKTLQSKGVNRIIALTHIGYDADQALARKVDGIDLIVGGHSHSLLGDFKKYGFRSDGPYPTVVKSPNGDPVYVVTAWQWASLAGVLTMTFDNKGRIAKADGDPYMLLDDRFLDNDKKPFSEKQLSLVHEFIEPNRRLEIMAEDPGVAALAAKYAKGIEPIKKEVIGKVADELIHVREPGESPDAGAAALTANGSLLAPHVAESMCFKADKVGIQADLSIQNAGGVRTSLHRGKLTFGQVYEVLPFNNTMVVIELTGQELIAALEHGVSRGGGAFPYPGRARYSVDMTRSKGSRIQSVEIFKNGKFVSVDPSARYRVLTISYLAGGGDAYRILEETKLYRYDTGFIDAETFAEYVEALPDKTLRRLTSTGVTVVK
jgi:5'-nucleotidase/UDP-sugar diphosphatase